MTDFSVEVYQNEYLPAGATEVNAVLTVTASGSAPPGHVTSAEVILVDCSVSMEYPRSKINAAKQATEVAIDTLHDGVQFAVVAGCHETVMVYPEQPVLATSSPRSRSAAKSAVRRLATRGGTAMGTWLTAAKHLFANSSAELKHAILLTDGRNEHEKPAEFEAALRSCAGAFTCDARGVGTDWVVAELRTITSTLLGTVDIVADPADLAADFRQMAQTAMGKSVADVGLRIWTPRGATVKYVKQVLPTVEDLTARRAEVKDRVGDYPTGAWGAESRDYHVCVEVPAAGVGDEMLAARVSLVRSDSGADAVLAQGLVRAVWTDEVALSTRISPQVAHYTGQAELAEAIRDGLAARRDGDHDTATTRLGRAVQLASQSGNEAVASLLSKVVDVDDPVTGTVRLRARVEDADEMALDTRSTKTVRVGKGR